MNQIIFLMLLYFVGLLAGWCWKDRLPTLFIVASAFMWGLVLWVVLVVLIWALPVQLSTDSAVGSLAVVGVVCFAISWKCGHWHLQKRDWSLLMGGITLCLLLLLLLVNVNMSMAATDGFTMISTGVSFGGVGFDATNAYLLDRLGIFTMAVHGAAPMLGESYLYAAQPMLSASLIAFLAYAVYRGIMLQGGKSWLAILFILVTLSLLLTSFMVRYQLTYIHANLSAGTYLMVALVSLWFAHTESNDAWLAPFTAALIGFGLMRVEAPLFAIVYLVVMISLPSLSLRSKFWALLAFSLVIGTWFLYIALVIKPDILLSASRILLLIIAPIIGLWGLLAVLQTSLGTRWLLPHLQSLIVAGLVLLVLLGFIVNPQHISRTIGTLFVNVSLLDDWWGLLWLVIGVMLLAPFGQSSSLLKFLNQLLLVGLLLVVLSALGRGAYRLGWDDSGNRMLLHLLPTLLFAFAMKYGARWPGISAGD